MPATAPVNEIGYAQNVNYNWWLYENETTPELIWPQSVYVFDQMRRTDAQVASVLRAVMLPVRRTPWRIEPAGARARVVKFVADDLGLPIVGKNPTVAPRLKDRFSWPEHLRQALLMLVFGHMFFEQVYRVDDGGTAAHLRKLAPRPPKTIERIDVAPDGGLIAIKQYWTSTDSEPKPIPVDRLVAYVHDREGGNWLGNSLLRPAYKHWLIKDRLLRVQAQTIERNGMGVPLYKAAETETDLAPGLAMAKSWRAGEAAGSAVPNGADLVLRGVEGDLPDADPAIRYHDEQLARAVLAHFLNLGTQTGSWALGTTFADFFTLSLQTLAQQIADIATQHIVEDLVDVNFGEDEPAPRIVFDEIGSRQAATAQALKALIDAGVIHPDQVLEESSRQQYGLPPADPATATVPAAPAAAPSAAPPAPTQMGDMSVAAAAMADPKGLAAGAAVEARYDPAQLRNPHSGEWAKGGGAERALIDAVKAVGGLSAVRYEDGSYLDWSSRHPDGSRDFEVADPGGDAVNLALTSDDLLGLHAALTDALTGGNSNNFHPAGQSADNGYIDWSTRHKDGSRTVEFGDPGGVAVTLDLDEAQMQQWHQALTLSLLVEATTVKASTSLMASLRRVAAKFNPAESRVPGGEHGGEQLKHDPSIVDMLDMIQAAAGRDVAPGHDELHHYWTKDPRGLGQWADSPKPWTTLVALLTPHVGPAKAKVYASRWFIEVFGYAAGSDKNRVAHGRPPRGHVVGPG
jgi:hypothetical protein